MKYYVITICLLLNFAGAIRSQNKIIQLPPFTTCNSNNIEVEKVALSDTATVLFMKAFYEPNQQFRIPSSSSIKTNNEELYHLRYGIGITPDHGFSMPQSGEAEFQLVFPPIPSEASSIDFLESNEQRGFNIWGIRLDGKWPELELPKETAVHTIKYTTLPSPRIENQKAIFKGRLLGSQPESNAEITIELNGAINLMPEVHINVNKDGSFYSEIPIVTTTPAIIYTGDGPIKFFLAPGEETILYINLREIHRRNSNLHRNEKANESIAYFGGYMAELSKEIAEVNFIPTIDDDFEQLIADLKDKNPEEVKSHILNLTEQKRKCLGLLKTSPIYKELMQYEINASAAMLLSAIPTLIQQIHIENYNLRDEALQKYMDTIQIKIPDSFYNTTLKDLVSFNDPKALYSPIYTVLITNEECKAGINKVIGIDKTLYSELSTASKILSSINEQIPATEEELSQLSSLSNLAYAEAIKQKNNELLATIKKNKEKTGFTINDPREVSNEELFKSILAKYQGKVVLVDFWATWCGPCRLANQEMLPLKEELKDKDIVYVYLTDESSPKSIWENTIPDIHGEHFRLTQDQWKYLYKNFEIKGIPTYFIINPEGKVAARSTGFPGIDLMKRELLKAFGQQ